MDSSQQGREGQGTNGLHPHRKTGQESDWEGPGMPRLPEGGTARKIGQAGGEEGGGASEGRLSL